MYCTVCTLITVFFRHNLILVRRDTSITLEFSSPKIICLTQLLNKRGLANLFSLTKIRLNTSKWFFMKGLETDFQVPTRELNDLKPERPYVISSKGWQNSRSKRLAYRRVKLWNELSEELKTETFIKFKKLYKETFINNYWNNKTAEIMKRSAASNIKFGQLKFLAFNQSLKLISYFFIFPPFFYRYTCLC